jgi:type IV secretory pathway TrbF-like protein
MTDRIAIEKGLEQVYAYARGPARTVLDDYDRANNPFEIAKTYVVAPTVTSLLRLSPR